MPRKRRKSVGRAAVQLVDPARFDSAENMDLVDCLLRGDRAFCRLLDGAAVFESEEEERQTWYLNRDMLLSLQTGQLSEDFRIYVGNRPWGWWKYGSGLGSEIWSDPERFGINWRCSGCAPVSSSSRGTTSMIPTCSIVSPMVGRRNDNAGGRSGRP